MQKASKSFKCIKIGDSRVLVTDKEIKERWKSYFEKLLNETHMVNTIVLRSNQVILLGKILYLIYECMCACFQHWYQSHRLLNRPYNPPNKFCH